VSDARQRFSEGKGTSLEEVRRKLGI
jgi:hypothetical protein